MTVTEMRDLAGFNALTLAQAERALLTCCSAASWGSRVAEGRPYHDAEALEAAADAALAGLDEQQLDQALAGHPRIGEQVDESHPGASRREQAGLLGAADSVITALAEGNAAYEARFGHVYLVCADGRNGTELLRVLTQRLHNDATTERAQARAELGKINRIRLRRLINAEPQEIA